MTDTTSLLLEDAAAHLGRSRPTLMRLLAAGAFPGASRDERGRWMIPLADLDAHRDRPRPPRRRESPTRAEETAALLKALVEKVDALAAALARVEAMIDARTGAAPRKSAAPLEARAPTGGETLAVAVRAALRDLGALSPRGGAADAIAILDALRRRGGPVPKTRNALRAVIARMEDVTSPERGRYALKGAKERGRT